MNEGQEKFLKFILERVAEGKEEAAKALLSESFGKQASGDFNTEYLQEFMPRMVALLKPEMVEQVMSIMQNYGPAHTNS